MAEQTAGPGPGIPRRRLGGVVAGLATLLTAAGCGAPAGADTRPAITFVGPAASTPSTANLQSNLFVEGGYGAAQGLEVSLAMSPGPQALAALSSGAVHYVLTNPATVFNAVDAGAPVRIVASYSLTFPTAIVARTASTSVAQLAGRTIAVSSLGDVPQIYTNAYLTSSGLVDPTSVRYAGAGNYANAMSYVSSGRADAAWVLVANLPTLLKNPGLHVLVAPDEFARLAPSAGTVVVVAEQFAASHRDEVQRVVDMVVGGSRRLYDDRAGYLDLVRRVLPDVYSDAEASDQYAALRPTLAVNGGMDGRVLTESRALWARFTAAGGVPQRLTDVGQALDTSFAAVTVARLGRIPGVMDSGDLLPPA